MTNDIDEPSGQPPPPSAASLAAAVEWSRESGWPISAGIESAVTQHAHEPCSPAAPEAPEVAFVLARTGNRRAGLALARALAEEELRLDSGEVHRTADVVICRLWAARVELRDDEIALATAQELLDTAGLDPVRRALLHYGVAATIMERPVDALSAELEVAGDHVHTALTLAETLGMHELAAAALSRLAIVELPSTHLAITERLSGDALALELPHRSIPARWQVRAAIVYQWSRHLQGHRIDRAVLDDIVLQASASVDRVLLPYRGALAAVAAMESGDIRRARGVIDHANADRRLRGLGTWRLPLMMLDGYLAVISNDAARVRAMVNELSRLPAPAESLLLRAVHLAGLGELRAGLAALRPVTATSVKAMPLTFSTACALEAVLHSRLGEDDAAVASMRQALGAAEPMGALRVFTLHSVSTTAKILDQVLDGATGGWTADVRRYVDRFGESPLAVLTTSVGAVAAGPDEGSGETIPTLTGSPLTNRERQVLTLVNEGASQAAMARELYVSLNTVKTHLRSIRQKLGVDRTGEAAAMARSAGWLDPPRRPGDERGGGS